MICRSEHVVHVDSGRRSIAANGEASQGDGVISQDLLPDYVMTSGVPSSERHEISKVRRTVKLSSTYVVGLDEGEVDRFTSRAEMICPKFGRRKHLTTLTP
jgi:hypothetical protein